MKLWINFQKYWDWKFNKKVLLMMLPLVIQSMIVAFVNILDTIFISVFNPEQLTGLGLTNDIFILLIYSFWAISSAGGIYTSQYLGKKNYEKVAETTRIKLILVLILAVIYFLLITFLRKTLINFIVNLDHNLSSLERNDIVKSGEQYLKIINYTTWFVGISLIFYNTMYECGDVWIPLYINLLPLVINAILDPIFIKVLGWGVEGAAWATVIARAVELIIIVGVLIWQKPVYYPGWKIYQTTWNLWKKILKSFVFIFLANALFGLSLLIQKMILLKEGFLDRSYQAAILTFSIISIFYSVFNGYYVVVPYFIGRKLGANQIEAAKRNFSKLLRLALILNALIAILIMCSASFILNFFTGDYEIVYIAKLYLVFQGIAFFFLGTSILLFNVLRIGGKNFLSSVVDILCTWIFIVALTWVAFKFLKPDDAVTFNNNWVSITIWVFLIVSLAEAIQFTILFLIFKKVKWANNLVKTKHEGRSVKYVAES